MESNAQSNEENKTNVKVYKGNEYTIITEGKADILYPIHHQVFYNPVQQFNRDISILSIKLFIDDYKKKCKLNNDIYIFINSNVIVILLN